jgi:hypothetical protein
MFCGWQLRSCVALNFVLEIPAGKEDNSIGIRIVSTIGKTIKFLEISPTSQRN